MAKDYYDILGVAKTASPEEVKAAFRKKAHQYHPDKQGGDEAKFKEINEAYQVLSNAKKREQYDRFGADFNQGRTGSQGFSGFNAQDFDLNDFGDIFGGFGDIFGGFGGQSRQSQRPARGRDLEMLIKIDFHDSIFGVSKELSYQREGTCPHCSGSGSEPGAKVETCPTCQGRGQVTRTQATILGNIRTQSVCPDCGGVGQKTSQICKECRGRGHKLESISFKANIPGGIMAGGSIRFTGKGDAGEKGAPSGDLVLHVQVKPHSRLVRDGLDIRSEEEISIVTASLGGKIEIETAHGSVTLKIPAGTQSGTVFKIKEKGAPRVGTSDYGNHLAKVIVKIPTKLSRKQKDILESLGLD